jgi:hypothetical protein
VLRSGAKNNLLKGISFLTDSRGRKVAVQIDLKEHADLWEDIYDSLIAAERACEPRQRWADVKNRLRRQRRKVQVNDEA